MKRRHRFALNVLSLGLLAFALYLNFFKEEPENLSLPLAGEKMINHRMDSKPFNGVQVVATLKPYSPTK